MGWGVERQIERETDTIFRYKPMALFNGEREGRGEGEGDGAGVGGGGGGTATNTKAVRVLGLR